MGLSWLLKFVRSEGEPVPLCSMAVRGKARWGRPPGVRPWRAYSCSSAYIWWLGAGPDRWSRHERKCMAYARNLYRCSTCGSNLAHLVMSCYDSPVHRGCAGMAGGSWQSSGLDAVTSSPHLERTIVTSGRIYVCSGRRCDIGLSKTIHRFRQVPRYPLGRVVGCGTSPRCEVRAIV